MKDIGQNGHGAKWDRKKELAIAALLREPTISAAAKSIAVSDSTLWRWLQCPDFKETYRRARHAVVDDAVAHLQGATSEAVNTIFTIMTDSKVKANIRLSAAKSIMELALKSIETEEFQMRLTELENVIKNRNFR